MHLLKKVHSILRELFSLLLLFNVSPGLIAQTVENLPVMPETRVRSLCWEVPLEKGMVIHSSILAWRIPRLGSLEGYSHWGRKESNMTE